MYICSIVVARGKLQLYTRSGGNNVKYKGLQANMTCKRVYGLELPVATFPNNTNLTDNFNLYRGSIGAGIAQSV
jgi:hypothetical protein